MIRDKRWGLVLKTYKDDKGNKISIWTAEKNANEEKISSAKVKSLVKSIFKK